MMQIQFCLASQTILQYILMLYRNREALRESAFYANYNVGQFTQHPRRTRKNYRFTKQFRLGYKHFWIN